jgi:hypothetical protein
MVRRHSKESQKGCVPEDETLELKNGRLLQLL